MSGIVFVCTGNICRSAYAERRAAHLAPGVEFSSAGTHALRNAALDDEMVAELASRGGSADGFRSRQLTVSIASEADLLLCATQEHRAWIIEEFPQFAAKTFVMKAYAAELCTSETAQAWQPLPPTIFRPALTRDDDIADPYRLGRSEAARAADEIDAVLMAVIGSDHP